MGYSYKSSRGSSLTRKYARSGTGQRRNSGNRGNKRGVGQYIDPARFIKSAVISEVEAYEPIHTFKDFAMHDVLKQNLARRGYATPSPIQDQAIPVALGGKDVIGIANTGTGKTAAFALPILNRLLTDPRSRALIIAPTRELAQQIEAEFKTLGNDTRLDTVVLIGGSSMGYQLRTLQRNPRIVIGTPGRIKDHLQRGSLKLTSTNIIALDEVDRMLDMGFLPDVRAILQQLSPQKQSLFFSATMDSRIRTLIETFTNDPVTISLKASVSSDSVHQDIVRFQGTSEKIDKLHDLLIQEHVSKVIIFDETQRSVERLSKELVERGFTATSIHGGKSQGQRQRALASFKTNQTSILVATDVAARGIDVADITHVINFSVPKTYDDYVHRIGRAGRAGQIGHALTFVDHKDAVHVV